MDFKQTLQEHLRAMADRDFEAFAGTVSRDEVVLVTAEGEFLTEPEIFLGRHREWFSMPGWSIETRILHERQNGDVAHCVLELLYREGKDQEAPQRSILGLVFERTNGRWLMVQDQNTPIRD